MAKAAPFRELCVPGLGEWCEQSQGQEVTAPALVS